MSRNNEPIFLETLKPIIFDLQGEWEPGSEERKTVLNEVIQLLTEYFSEVDDPELTFICTHNSRRSHLSQVWAQVASEFYDLGNLRVQTYSGGTEATACNPRTVNAFRRAGFSVVKSTDTDNPKYLLQFAENRPAMELFSKVYDQEGNPTHNYAAIMTCDHADQNCPIVRGCNKRISFPFVDPKVADDTNQESMTYDNRLREIGRELFYVFRNVEKKLTITE